jgi:hypothetical protein
MRTLSVHNDANVLHLYFKCNFFDGAGWFTGIARHVRGTAGGHSMGGISTIGSGNIRKP